MARLQRKKTAGPKKKKKQEDGSGAEKAVSGGAAVKKSAFPAPSRESKKSQPPAVRKSAGEPGKIGGWINTAVQFLREVKVELKKVTWPSRKQTLGSTVVVLILVMIISFFLGMADVGLSSLIQVVLQ